ncbi:MAG: HAMP domain-containing protein [candidate division NC10 bacterium]|nr:HAMP domain-containing protein [candidate division NC10 bacterium]
MPTEQATLDTRLLLNTLTAVKNGDFSARLPVDWTGINGKIADTFNEVVALNEKLAQELARIRKVVGEEGKITQRIMPGNWTGAWARKVESINNLISDLTWPTSEMARVIGAVARGDLSQTMALEVEGRQLAGEFQRTSKTVNTMVEQLNGFASEVTRVAREVGTEGRLGGQAAVPGVAGTWKDLTDNVNFMAANLTAQVRNIAEVTIAVAGGDLSRKITVDARGEILELKNTVNTMVDQLNGFASEVTRVAREVGTEGRLGGQAQVPGVAGTWKDLTDNVNFMAANLTAQVRNIAEVTIAVANGDLARKITVDAKGEILQLKDTINIMVDQLNGFASEVTRVALEVGTEGRLGGQAQVTGVAGTWKNLTDSVNQMAANLTNQVRNIAEVTIAVANGDLARKITVDARGEILELKNTINTMVDRLNSFAAEVTRVAREVGTDGKLGGQAAVPGVAGTWKDLTDSVNFMAANLTAQVRNIAEVTIAVANGDLSKKIAVDVRGEMLQLKETINTMVEQLRAFAAEVTRVAREVGTDGKLGGQAIVQGVAGTWKDLTDNVNQMAGSLTAQVRNIAAVTTAVANGDLSKTVTVDVKGEMLELKSTINTMVGQLNGFAAEVTRVAREVGTDGKLGGQAQVRGAAGTWKDLTDNVNIMAANLTDQVRGIAKVVTAVANGDLKQKLAVQAKGEIATLGDTINSMIDTLATFADQVISVAREVGTEGRLGGQAAVPGVAGTWKDLTDNVNQLAANLTTQVRAIAEVATAVTKGDLTRSITVEARAEVAELKDNINEMIRNLRETTKQNTEQDWLKTNLTKFTRMLQGQRDMLAVARTLLSELAPLVGAAHGVFYVMETDAGKPQGAGTLKLLASYAFTERKNISNTWHVGEGLVGQAAFEKQRILLSNVPSDYIQITSGLGQASPLNIIVLPVLFEGVVKAVIELGAFERFSPIHQSLLDQLTESIGIVLNTIEAGSRTEELLKQSQSLAQELGSQQEELQQTNEELEEKARLLAEQNTEVERKNTEIEVARTALEEKAEQLALTSKYKSEFLANMSHELRTPLNSLLILSQQLAENPDGNMTGKQVEFASTIHGSGSDLLNLINDILDLSKIESGTVTVDVEEVLFSGLRDHVERMFRHVATSKGLGFEVELNPNLPRAIYSDTKRLQQVLKNLLSNAFKFTEKGQVDLRMFPASEGWSRDHDILNRAQKVIAFAVSDTGIGIPLEKQKIIFEAFQQAEGGTARKYGGTGLGLAISREIAHLLGGEIRLVSTPGQGSTFTLYLPQTYVGPSTMFPGMGGSGGGASGPGPSPATPAPSAPGGTAAAPGRRAVSKASVAQATPAATLGATADDRATIQSGDRTLLIVEDDPKFSAILLGMAREKGFKGLVTARGEEALILAREHKPTAITLDIILPDIDGWTVLDRLKIDPATRHIPVHIISVEDDRRHGLEHGALAYLTKPVSKEALDEAFARIQAFAGSQTRKLLVVEDDETDRRSIVELIGNGDVQIVSVGTGKEALTALRAERYDCMVLDLKLPDISGFQVLERMQKQPALRDVPVIVYTGKELSKREAAQLQQMAQTVIVKGARSPERLLAETSLFLHRMVTDLPPAKRHMLEALYQSDTALNGKKVLVVDDDVRNIFALTSALERHSLVVVSAENGRQALERLQNTPDIDLVLMDVMMPEMDGYDTTRAIRKNPKFKKLPIIALTAKAMKGDREKCLEAGTSDYIAKPVNTDQLLSLMRVWLYK